MVFPQETGQQETMIIIMTIIIHHHQQKMSSIMILPVVSQERIRIKSTCFCSKILSLCQSCRAHPSKILLFSLQFYQ